MRGGLCPLCYSLVPDQLSIIPQDYIHEYTPEQREGVESFCVYSDIDIRMQRLMEYCSLSKDPDEMLQEWTVVHCRTKETYCCRCAASRGGTLLVGNVKTGYVLTLGSHCAVSCGIITDGYRERLKNIRRRYHPTMVAYNT